jgi:hypothetical protein
VQKEFNIIVAGQFISFKILEVVPEIILHKFGEKIEGVPKLYTLKQQIQIFEFHKLRLKTSFLTEKLL